MSDNKEKQSYIRTGSLKRNLIYTGVIDARTNKPERKPLDFDEEITEEVTFTLKCEDAKDLANRLSAHSDDPEGTGSVRVSMWLKRVQPEGQHAFNGGNISVSVVKPFKPQRGAFNGSYPRRDYPASPAQLAQPQKSTRLPKPQGAPKVATVPQGTVQNGAPSGPAIDEEVPF